MITKTCPICKQEFLAKNNRAKNCSRKCAIVSSKSLNQTRFDRRRVVDPLKSQSTNNSTIKDFLEDFVPRMCMARQMWNKSFKYQKDKSLTG